jgi:RHS repeat-associated protein
LYIDSQVVITNGLGISNWPSYVSRTNGFCIGSARGGTNQARGRFDNLRCHNFPRPALDLLIEYSTACFSGMDVELVIDKSGSMFSPQTKFDSAKTGATNFVNTLNFPQDRAGLIAFSTAPATNMQSLTTDKSLVLPAISRISTSGGSTFMSNAIATAHMQLYSNHLSGNLPVMVLLTDGLPDSGTTPQTDSTNFTAIAATWAKTNNTRIVTIALGSDAATNFLKYVVASSTNLFYYAPDPTNLTQIYNILAQALCRTNQAPVVAITNLSDYQVFTVPATIPIIASASDPQNALANVEFYSGTTDLGGALHNPYGINWGPVTNGGTYALTAIATNGYGLCATSAIVHIVVSNPAPFVQITNPVNKTFFTHRFVPVQAIASTPSGTISNVQFYARTNGGSNFLIGRGDPTNGFYQVSWSLAAGGTYILTANVTDSRGSNGWSAPVTNFVRNIPSVSITNPVNNQIFLRSPTNLTLRAVATADPSTTITNVTFYNGTNYQPSSIIGISTSGVGNVFSIPWNNVTIGTYILSARAFDANGASNLSATVSIIVATNQPPAVYIGPDQTNGLSTNALQLVGLVSDDGLPSGTLSVNWTNISGPAIVGMVITNQQTAYLSFSQTGAYRFVLSAYDGQYITYSTNTITVVPANQGPTVSAGTNQTVTLAARYTVTNNLVGTTTSENSKSSEGKEFWLGFPQGFSTPALTLFISSKTTNSGSISVPGLGFFTNFTALPGVAIAISLPKETQVTTDDQVDSKGIHIRAQDDITVYGLSEEEATSDAYLGLPVKLLGTNYLVLGWPNIGSSSEFLIVGTAKGTHIRIYPTADDIYRNRAPGNIININLDEGQTYQLQSDSGDLSGTVIAADKPVALFAGNRCADVPDCPSCDIVVEQIPPADAWGKEFYTVPLAERNGGDIFQVLASADGTTVWTNGVPLATLTNGQVFMFLLADRSQVKADKSILLAQYARGQECDPGNLGGDWLPDDGFNYYADPFMMLIPPFEQFLTHYTIGTPTIGFPFNYVNIVTANNAVTNINIRLDGSIVDPTNFFSITNGFYGAQIQITNGSHTLESALPFGAYVYGWDLADGYGYPGGMSLGSVADISKVLLIPKFATDEVGTTYCFTANVTGASNQPLSGIRVDFQIKGSNSVAGSAYTDENGQADFCYAGTNSGNDVITASVGANSDVATNIWTYPSFTLHGSVSDDGLPVGKTNILWALLSGPPIVGISAPTNINPLVQITEPGFYSFKLTADDTVLTNSAQVGISVVRNQAPSVNPGTNLTTKSASVTLHGSVTDDGLPAGSLTTTWSKASGPGSVTFGNANQPVTSATFGSPGVYVLRLTGNDSQAAVYADVAATVLINPQPIQCAQVVTGNLASTALHSIELTNSYADYYQFSGQSNHFVVVTLTSTNFDAYLIIRNQQLQIMAEEDDCFDDTIGSTNSLITYCLPVDGNYIIEVASALGQQTGSYTLQFQCGLPVDLEITSPADGTIYPNVPAAVTVNAIAANFDDIQYVELDTNGVRLDNFISLGDNINNTYSWPSVSAGTYSLTAVVYDYSSTAIATSAPVVIHVGMPSMVLSPSTECIKLLPGLETLTASLKDASGNPVVGNNITFTVTGANPTNATIVTSGSGVASFSYTGINSGRDIITATATVGGLAAQAAVERDWAKPISCGQILSAPLTNSSGTSSRMGYADYYSFSSLSNDTVAVTLGSSAFDTYLLLRDANCNLVASNDDFNGTDSQIIYTLPANGTYVIEATSYAPGQTGLYTLQLECNPVTANGAPEIVMLQGSQILSNYATVSFGATTVTNPIPISLTISNSGTTALALGPVQAAGDFVVSNWPAASIPAGGAASFIVRFNASTNEIQVGQLGFANNDADESPFILNLSAVANIPGTPPTATITSPVNNSVFSFGTNVSVAATATASGGYSITNVDFVVLTGAGQMLIGTKTTPPYTINWANANPGYYALYAVAYDSAGRVGYSTPAVNVLIQIQSTNHPPVANSDTVTVSAGSFNNVIYPLKNDFDSDGDHLTIVGVQPSTLTPQHPSHGIPIIMPGGQSIQYTPPPGQGYPIDGFSYQISDSRGGTSWGSVYVNAFAPPEPRVTLTNPPDRYSTNAGAIVPLVAYVDVANQYITNVDFYLGQVVIGRMTNGVNGFYTNYWTASYDNCGCGFTAQAEDSFGQIGTSQEIHIDVTQPTNGTLVVGLDNLVGSSGSIPLTNGVIIRDGLLSIYGQAYHTATNIVAWRLDLFAGDGTNFIRNLTPSPDTNGYHWGPIGSSDTTNVLTTNCDLTTIQNGSYDLKLTAVGGYTMQSVDARIILDSTLKIGQFSFSQQDLAIPVDGIPLTITRTYNSLNPVRGDFGYSWTFSINSMDVSIDETRGDVEDFDNYVFNRRSGGGYDVSLTMPDGHRTTFYCNLRNGGSTTYYAEWEIPPDAPDVQSFVCMGDNRLQTFLALGDPSAQPYWQATGAGVPMEAYDFPGFVLTMKDGTTYIISREDLGDHDMSGDTWLSAEDQEQAWGRPYLSQILERNGDTINISSTSVTFTATNGATRQIEFNRNADGLITSVSDPSDLNSDGTTNGSPPAVKYEYDAYDNLMYVERLVDRNLGTYATNSFAYEYPTFPHYITGIFNADGTQVAKNFYDDSGRLIALQDADGKITRFIHNSTYDMEVVIDRLGRTNTYVYDSRGNVILETNALNQATFNSYDNNNNLLSTTDALNNTTRYAYDSNNRRIQVVDALNHTNFFSYSPGGDFTGLTDPLGNVATNLYDGSGNLTNTTQLDPQNHVIAQSSSVYQGGRLFQTLNGNGQATATFGYDPATGYLTASTDANGFAHTFAYDANGSQTNSSYNWVDSGGTTHIVTAATIHDAQGRVAMTIDADGNTNQTFYTVNGKVSYTIDTFGNTNSFTYDARGNVIQIVYPNGTFARTVYDDDAKPILMTDPNQITGTFNQYDALGRMTNVVRLANVSINLISDPTNTSLSTSVIGSLGIGLATNATVYMANGWVQSRTGADGKITSYDYWPDGQIKTVTDPLNHTTFYQYDAAGHQQFITDALNHTNRFTYDPVGRLIKTLYANNTFTTNVFDNLGQRIGIKDQASLLTQFGYDVSGRLTNVIKPSVIDTNGHPVNPTWSYRYDQYERLTATIDPNSRATTNLYDALGRQISQRLPMGQTNYAVYNSKGQLWKQYDFKNQRSEFVYDRFGRVKARFLFQAGATNPDEAVCYLYNQLTQLTNVVERYGADASTNACDGYAALVGFPKDNHGLEAELLASFNQKPSLAGALAVALLALTFACVPREKRRRFVLRLVDAWRIQLLVLAPVGVESTRLRKRWMPSLFWRAVSMLIMLVFIADDPAFERFYTARADCSVPFNGSTPTTRYTYFSYDLEGNLTQVNSPEGVINCDYDLTTGRLMGICTGNSEVDYRYDELGRLQYVTVIRRNGQVLSTLETTMYHYDAAGNRSEVDLPNGVKTFYAYDSLNRLTNLVHQLGAVTNASYSYKLDGTERRTNAVEVLRQEDNSYLTNVLSWQFDGMYRLTNEVSLSTTSSGAYAYTNAYQYDNAGNRVKKTRTGGGAEAIAYQYDNNDQLTNEVSSVNGTTTYRYDQNGSLTNRTQGSTVNSYVYDAANKLRSVTVNGTLAASYLYDEQGIRVSSTSGGTTTHYLIDANNCTGYAQVVEERIGSSSVPSMSYVIGDEVLAQCGATSTAPNYFLVDGHGSNRQLTRADGTVSSHYGYDAYGMVQTGNAQAVTSSSTAEVAAADGASRITSKLYCGEQYDSNLHMYNLRARYYDPADGRFNQRDTMEGSNFDPENLHKYLYCTSDPIDKIDPSGNQGEIEELVVTAIEGILFAINAVSVVNGVLGAIVFGFSAINAWMDGLFWDGCGYAIMAALNGLSAALSYMGMKASLKPPSGLSGGLALAMNGGATAVWEVAVAHPEALAWGIKVVAPAAFGVYMMMKNGKVPIQEHHKVPWSNSKYDFKNHPLIKRAGVNLEKDPRNLMDLANHAGRHSKIYLEAVLKRLDDAWASLGGNPSQAAADAKFKEVVDQIEKDISNGSLRPYNPPHDVWIP